MDKATTALDTGKIFSNASTSRIVTISLLEAEKEWNLEQFEYQIIHSDQIQIVTKQSGEEARENI
jgi:hypothetical protein